jgi:glyoxylate/hydroxypyruvate reductase A
VHVLFISEEDDPAAWGRELAARLPDLRFTVWPDAVDVSSVDAALCFSPPPGLLAALPNLRVVQSLAAGLDHLAGDRAPPPGVPVLPMADPGAPTLMAEYMLAAVMRHHRGLDALASAQAAGRWQPLPVRAACERRVGVLGLGRLGLAACTMLQSVGFQVTGWSRSVRDLPGLRTLHGPDGLDRLAGQSDILVCLLPLTPETAGILNARLFRLLPRGAFLVNAGRGGHLVEPDLLRALDSGELAGATLDVFTQEPIAPGHPFWRRADILITPHVAAFPRAETAADVVADALRTAAGRAACQQASLA